MRSDFSACVFDGDAPLLRNLLDSALMQAPPVFRYERIQLCLITVRQASARPLGEEICKAEGLLWPEIGNVSFVVHMNGDRLYAKEIPQGDPEDGSHRSRYL